MSMQADSSSARLKQMVQTGSGGEVNLLLYDSVSSLCLLNLDFGFFVHCFFCSFLEQGNTIRDIRFSLGRRRNLLRCRGARYSSAKSSIMSPLRVTFIRCTRGELASSEAAT
jgi:hypothetical protein